MSPRRLATEHPIPLPLCAGIAYTPLEVLYHQHCGGEHCSGPYCTEPARTSRCVVYKKNGGAAVTQAATCQELFDTTYNCLANMTCYAASPKFGLITIG
eukprot:1475483-Prymnesium_polylepis.2